MFVRGLGYFFTHALFVLLWKFETLLNDTLLCSIGHEISIYLVSAFLYLGLPLTAVFFCSLAHKF